MLAQHVSDLNGPSSGTIWSYMLQNWYVVFSVLLGTSRCYALVGKTGPQNIWTYRVLRKIPHPKFATYSLKSLLRMDYSGPKHVEPPNVMNRLDHKTLCIWLDYRYTARWYTVHTISSYVILITFPRQKRLRERASMVCHMYIACLLLFVVLSSEKSYRQCASNCLQFIKPQNGAD